MADNKNKCIPVQYCIDANKMQTIIHELKYNTYFKIASDIWLTLPDLKLFCNKKKNSKDFN